MCYLGRFVHVTLILVKYSYKTSLNPNSGTSLPYLELESAGSSLDLPCSCDSFHSFPWLQMKRRSPVVPSGVFWKGSPGSLSPPCFPSVRSSAPSPFPAPGCSGRPCSRVLLRVAQLVLFLLLFFFKAKNKNLDNTSFCVLRVKPQLFGHLSQGSNVDAAVASCPKRSIISVCSHLASDHGLLALNSAAI